jgi:hypothetical protein
VVPLGLLPYEEENDMMEKADEWASAEVRWAAVASFLLSPFFCSSENCLFFSFFLQHSNKKNKREVLERFANKFLKLDFDFKWFQVCK